MGLKVKKAFRERVERAAAIRAAFHATMDAGDIVTTPENRLESELSKRGLKIVRQRAAK